MARKTAAPSTQDYFTEGIDLSSLNEHQLKLLVKEMGIGDNGPLVDRAFKEALPHQYDREVVKNCLEAGATEILISPDWIDVEENRGKRYRYLAADDGIGMTGDELVMFFNRISSSGKIIGTDDNNFGVGAKISLLPWNTQGLVVMSWKDDESAMIKIVKLPNGNYALHRWVEQDDEGNDVLRDFIDAPQTYKDRFLPKSKSGTILVALGREEFDDTFLGPEEAGPSNKVHAKTLNQRFFDLPKGLTLRTYEFDSSDKKAWPQSESTTIGGQYRRVQGAKSLLDQFAVSQGTVLLHDGSKVHWWLQQEYESGLKGATSPRQNLHAHAYDKSFVAALVHDDYGSELYNVRTHKDARHLYHMFGVLYEQVYRNLTIVVEPPVVTRGKITGAYPNTPRSELLYAGTPGNKLPWQEWGEEFAHKIPPEIRNECEKAAAQVTVTSHKLFEKIKRLLPRMRTLKFRLNVKGRLKITPNAKGGRKKSANPNSKPNPHKKNGGVGGKAGRNYSGEVGNGSQRGSKVNPRADFPTPEWRFLANNTRAEGENEGRAAEYTETEHKILINGDFTVFQEAVTYWLGMYSHMAGAEKVIRDVIQDVYTEELVARIMHARALEGTATWTSDSWKTLTSPEALTMAVLGLNGAEALIATRLGGRLGGTAKKIA